MGGQYQQYCGQRVHHSAALWFCQEIVQPEANVGGRNLHMASCFFQEQEGLREPLLKFYQQLPRGLQTTTKSNKREVQGNRGKRIKREKRHKENENNYTNCSSHEIIKGKFFFFAPRITRPKNSLKQRLHLSSDAASPLKMKLFLTDQMLQHIKTMISMEKETLSWDLRLSRIYKGSTEFGI